MSDIPQPPMPPAAVDDGERPAKPTPPKNLSPEAEAAIARNNEILRAAQRR